MRVSSPERWFLEFSSVPNFKFFNLHALVFVTSSLRLDLHGFCFLPSFIALNFSFYTIDRLQPRDKAAMLVVKTIKNFFAEFA